MMTDQTVHMHRLIWVFVGLICPHDMVHLYVYFVIWSPNTPPPSTYKTFKLLLAILQKKIYSYMFFNRKVPKYFLISPWKPIMRVLIRQALLRCFKWVPIELYFMEYYEKYYVDSPCYRVNNFSGYYLLSKFKPVQLYMVFKMYRSWLDSIRGINTLSVAATIKTALPPFWKGVYS